MLVFIVYNYWRRLELSELWLFVVMFDVLVYEFIILYLKDGEKNIFLNKSAV